MTKITAIDIRDGANRPFNGILTVEAIEPIVTASTQVLRYIGEIGIANGTFELELVPSLNKLYRFSFYNVVLNPGDVTANPPIEPYEERILVDEFKASIPQEKEIALSDIFEQTGISAGSFDASVLSITRKIYNDRVFWDRIGEEVLPAKGTFEFGSYYAKGDIVQWMGSSYRCIASNPVLGIEPDNTESWVLFSAGIPVAPVVPGLPSGVMMDYAGTVAPDGWLLCRGQSLSRTEYSTLFGILGTTYGSDTPTTFKLPDTRGRSTIGADSGANVTASAVLGAKIGQSTQTLTKAQMPSHAHDIRVASRREASGAPGANVLQHFDMGIGAVGATLFNMQEHGVTEANQVKAISMALSGSNAPVEMLQPNIVVNKIIKI